MKAVLFVALVALGKKRAREGEGERERERNFFDAPVFFSLSRFARLPLRTSARVAAAPDPCARVKASVCSQAAELAA